MMNSRLLFKASAIVEILTGLALLVAPLFVIGLAPMNRSLVFASPLLRTGKLPLREIAPQPARLLSLVQSPRKRCSVSGATRHVPLPGAATGRLEGVECCTITAPVRGRRHGLAV